MLASAARGGGLSHGLARDDRMDDEEDEERSDARAHVSSRPPPLSLPASVSLLPSRAAPLVAGAISTESKDEVRGAVPSITTPAHASPSSRNLSIPAPPPNASAQVLLGDWATGEGSSLFPPPVAAAPRVVAGARAGEEGAKQLYFVDFDSASPPSFASVSPRLLHRAAVSFLLTARRERKLQPVAPAWFSQGSHFVIRHCKQHAGRWQLLVESSRSEQSLNDDMFAGIGFVARAVPPKVVRGTLGPITLDQYRSLAKLAPSFPSLSLAPVFTAFEEESVKQFRNSCSYSIDAKVMPAFHHAALALLPSLIVRRDDPRIDRAAVCRHCTRYGHTRARCPTLLSVEPGCGRCGLPGHRAATCTRPVTSCEVCRSTDHSTLFCPKARRRLVIVTPPPSRKQRVAPVAVPAAAPPPRTPSPPASSSGSRASPVSSSPSVPFALPSPPTDHASASAVVVSIMALMANIQQLLQACLPLLSASPAASAPPVTAPPAGAASAARPGPSSPSTSADSGSTRARSSDGGAKRSRTDASPTPLPLPAAPSSTPVVTASASLGSASSPSATASAPVLVSKPYSGITNNAKANAKASSSSASSSASTSSSSSFKPTRSTRESTPSTLFTRESTPTASFTRASSPDAKSMPTTVAPSASSPAPSSPATFALFGARVEQRAKATR